MNKKELLKIEEKYSDFTADADRDWFDYLYDKESMLTLSGRKYSTPRNHINKFRKMYQDWSFEPINESNIPELIEFTRNFTFHAEKDESASLELEMCIEVLENYGLYGMPGGVLKVEDRIVGYSIGEIVGDTLFCHIEKADISYHGAYQMLTNQYLQKNGQSNYMLHICLRHIFLALYMISLSITFQNILFLLFLFHILIVLCFPYLLLSTARCFLKLIHISSTVYQGL